MSKLKKFNKGLEVIKASTLNEVRGGIEYTYNIDYCNTGSHGQLDCGSQQPD